LKKLALCIGLFIYGTRVAKASTITFDDGTSGNAIGTFYSSLGIIFSNATWAAVPPSLQIGGASGLLLEDVTDLGFNPPYSPTPTTPIVGAFSSPQDFVSILGVDVGAAGMELDVYDAVGNLIASPQFFGTGSGFGIFQTLSVSAPGIVRFDLFQPNPTVGDGIAFDNLSFQADPTAEAASAGSAADPVDIGVEPSTWVLLSSGLFALLAFHWWKRSKIRLPTTDARPRVASEADRERPSTKGVAYARIE
jgi:hypothetical protein